MSTTSSSPNERAPRFVLLLQGAATVAAGDEARVFEEYRAWAGRLRSDGRFVTGERLSTQAVEVPRPEGDGGRLQGFFVVSASDIADAVAVARSSPHVARGGHVVVRPVDPP